MADRVRLSSAMQFGRPLCRLGMWGSIALFSSAGLPSVGRADDQPVPSIATNAASAPQETETAAKTAADQPDLTKSHIDSLIRQLGSPRYSARRTAANELQQIGPEAFDLLHAATDDADPEVAASARYLLRQISVRWVASDDSAAVRRLLKDYGDQSDKVRLRRIDDLAKLPSGEGSAALCRVARFDRSPLLSRVAALAIIRPDDARAPTTPADPDIINRELGESTRTTSVWLRQYRIQLRDPVGSVVQWQQLINSEMKALESKANVTSSEIVLGLLWNLADLHRQLNDHSALMTDVDRMILLNGETADHTAINLLQWFVEKKSWEVVDEFLVKYDDQLSHSKRPLYIAAMARLRQGKNDLAEQLAEKAALLDSQAPLESFIAAKDLELRGQYTWSVREYQRALGNKDANERKASFSHESMLSRVSLANMLSDHEEFQKAAEVVEPLVKAVQEDGNDGRLYAEIVRYHSDRGELNLPDAKQLAARYHFYRSCLFRQEKDWQRQRDELETTIGLDPTDADALIAMYRVPESNDEWRAATRRRIAEMAHDFQQQIDQSPNDHEPYNQWAWLISNTEGDKEKAVRYSHRSIELLTAADGSSASSSYLDTLGRCYYAIGDYENAVKYERQAIDKLSYMQVMHRQLALFEKALAEKQGAANKEEGAEKASPSS